MGADATKGTAPPLFNAGVMKNLLDKKQGSNLNPNWFYGEMGKIMRETKDANPDPWLKENYERIENKPDDTQAAVIDWFNRIFWVPYKLLKHESIQWNAAQEAVLSELLSRYLNWKRRTLSPEEINQLRQAFVGGSFNKEKFNKVLKQKKQLPTMSNSGQNSNSNSRPRNSKPDQKPGQKQDNKASDDGTNIAEWTLPTARKHYDKCLIANKGQAPPDWDTACKRIAARFEELQNEQWDFEFWALVLGGGLCGLLFLFAFWWWWSGRMSSRGGGRGGRRGGRKQRGRYLP